MTDPDPIPLRRFGDDITDLLAALDEVGQPRREAREEAHLDALGQRRRFRLALYGGGALTVAAALRDDGREGLRLVERFDERSEPAPWTALRRRLGERLARRDLVADPDSGDPRLLTGCLRAQLRCDPERPDGPPAVLVDDRLLSWEQLGELLAAYEGWGLRLELSED